MVDDSVGCQDMLWDSVNGLCLTVISLSCTSAGCLKPNFSPEQWCVSIAMSEEEWRQNCISAVLWSKLPRMGYLLVAIKLRRVCCKVYSVCFNEQFVT